MKKIRKGGRGFTLVELIVTISVLVLLVIGSAIIFLGVHGNARRVRLYAETPKCWQTR